MDIQHMMRQARDTGHLHVCGEMEFDTNQGAMQAYHQAARIAEHCGYLVGRRSSSHFDVSGGDIPGYVVFDWFSPDAKQLVESKSGTQALCMMTDNSSDENHKMDEFSLESQKKRWIGTDVACRLYNIEDRVYYGESFQSIVKDVRWVEPPKGYYYPTAHMEYLVERPGVGDMWVRKNEIKKIAPDSRK